jgi:hypothetical protein
MYIKSSISFIIELVLSILKFFDSQVSSFSTPESGVSLTPSLSPITQVYT